MIDPPEIIYADEYRRRYPAPLAEPSWVTGPRVRLIVLAVFAAIVIAWCAGSSVGHQPCSVDPLTEETPR